MIKIPKLLFAAALMGLLLSPVGAWAQTASGTEPADLADDKLFAMSEFLKAAGSIKFVSSSFFDEPRPTGPSAKRFTFHKITLKRPNKLAFESAFDDGSQRRGWFDGKTLIIASPGQKAFSKIDFRGSVDDLLVFLEEERNLSLPVADFLYSDIYDRQFPFIMSSEYLGERHLLRENLDHLSFRSVAADWQIWIEQGKKPLPRRMLITYVRSPGDPEYMVTFVDWEIETATDKDFEMQIEEDWKEVPIPPSQ